MRILGAERTEYMTIGGYRFVGVIDRLDSTSRGEMRVVDYKTGRVEEDDLRFNPKAAGIPKIGLQLYLYKRLMQLRAPGANISGAIYQPALLMSGEKTIGLDLDEEFCSRMDAGLLAILSQISDLSVPWTRTEDTGKCKMCDFRAICGR